MTRINYLGVPNDKQKQFLLSKKKFIAYGGARGGGKSFAVRMKAKLLCLHYAGIKVLIVRRTYPELLNNHINILRSELNGIARYNTQDKIFTFPNGSTIKFGYCKTDADLGQYQGAEYDIVFIDEACLLSEFQIKAISACVRGVNDFPKRLYFTLNPGGQSHGYFKRIFIDRKFNTGENPEEYGFIQSLVTDNKALMESQPEYIRQLQALPPKLRDAWLYGRWDVFKGMFFEDFRTEVDTVEADKLGLTPEEAYKYGRFTNVIAPMKIPQEWRVYRAYDFGYGKPFAMLYIAVDFDGRAYVFDEYYGCTDTPNEGVKWNPYKQFKTIAEYEKTQTNLKGRDIIGVADPAIWDGSRGESVNDVAEKYGIYFDKGKNDRVAGWMQLHYRFAFDDVGKPMLYVCSNCKHTIRTLPLLMFDKTKKEDLDTSQEDHIADALRYWCMSRPIAPTIKKEPTRPQPNPLSEEKENNYIWH